MGTEVFANGSEIACQSGDGQVVAAFPDVCLSPPSPPAGPIPVPYPDTSASKDMQNGSSTVQIQGGPVMLKDQSFYQSSPLGDEAATNTFGGGVVTGVITGKTYFAAWSMDVKFEGQNVDRHLDLTTSNHSSEPGNEAVPLPNMSSMDTADIPPDKVLEGKVKEVTWDRSVKIAYVLTTVETPNWQEGLAVEDGGNQKIDGAQADKLNGSKRPGAYLVRGKGATTLTVKIEITENVNVSGNGTLRGVLGSLVMEGTCPTSAGEHTVTLNIKQLPDSIQWYKGDVSWALDVPDLGGAVALANQPRLEVFVILDKPQPFYTDGTWTEALRFLCGKIGVIGMRTPAAVAAAVAAYCHGRRHGLRYDTSRGAPSYGCSGLGGTFHLWDYIVANFKVVNCFDQAGAVQALCGAVGIKITWCFMGPFGFIKPTDLVGVGSCNNPFYPTTGSKPLMVGWDPVQKIPRTDSPYRTGFGCHAFGSLSSKILDACAGPHTGTESPEQYCAASIDSHTKLYAYSIYKGWGDMGPGTADDIRTPGGVADVV